MMASDQLVAASATSAYTGYGESASSASDGFIDFNLS